jgi:pilus assembly protein Flp/PilA
MLDYFKRWLIVKSREKGQDLAEYALLIGLIALVVVVAVTLLGTNISAVFTRIATTISTWPIGT